MQHVNIQCCHLCLYLSIELRDEDSVQRIILLPCFDDTCGRVKHVVRMNDGLSMKSDTFTLYVISWYMTYKVEGIRASGRPEKTRKEFDKRSSISNGVQGL